MKVVINTCHGGFGLSYEAVKRYAELKQLDLTAEKTNSTLIPYNFMVNGEYWWPRDIERNDEALVRTVEELGQKANVLHSDLKIVEVPDDVEWYIDEYDGNEWVAEKHRTWS